jgi:uncharacterized membrane protein YagU involved in acid resistance
MRPLSTGRALLYGTLAVGILDGLDAVVFFGLRGAGTRPLVIFQAIASGLLGRSAFAGGWTTAALGVLLHFFIAFVVVLVFVLASKRLAVLRRAPIVMGLLYGIAVYLVMNRIVVPLSAAAGGGSPPWPVLVNGVLIHMFGVGLPASLAARAANRHLPD